MGIVPGDYPLVVAMEAMRDAVGVLSHDGSIGCAGGSEEREQSAVQSQHLVINNGNGMDD
jgi:hypothetical protein